MSTPVATLAAELRVSLSRASRRLKAERGDADLPDPQFNVIALLHRQGPMTPGQLADIEHVQPPSMTRTVNCLVELGLVRKDEHPTDGRLVVVNLTDAGLAEVVETRRRRDAWLTARLTAMTPDERDRLADAIELLRRIATS